MSGDHLANRLWYARRKGQVLGPFSVTEIRKLCDRGNLAIFDTVSEDKRSWVSVESLFAELEPARPVQPSSEQPVLPPGAPTSYVALPEYRTISLSLGFLTFGQLFEILTGLSLIICVLGLAGWMNVSVTSGFFYTASILAFTFALGYHLLYCLGYGFATRVSEEVAPRWMPVTNLFLHIFNFLLDAALIVMTIITMSTGSSMNDRIYEFIINVRLIAWIPLSIINMEWLRALCQRFSQSSPGSEHLSKSISMQTRYFGYFYSSQYLVLAILAIIGLLTEDSPGRRTALTLQICFVLTLMFIMTCAFWRLGMHYMSWHVADNVQKGG
ncbi:MAG: hypothetical protein U0796_16035 [Gemmatales bacterium]